ncbi:membrane protein (plasmid) [Rhizobium leguminosarum bv. trifolii CB782]|uniref:DUF945 domain-containing protein n=1 Tax=Rhizobium hidalgonense TaxID=1538159 RepID=A0ABX4JRY5_9HYPH|nr:hypothetical protein [Rhizobium hidalgonense]AHG48085.1 membrane protein [Rhizobium leguminosarum bv. trifolii CB782]EJC72410.1 hypothetical protein Rleg10DRAFT_0825 [Rhizobium leguminosarum bv. trifolii WSM2012]MDR9802962.1 hypothetical protein [Rhizobium hidalgonense]PDT22809.1 hypothetical protein CO674_15060 [Rhizobium hidalgonense]PON09475.1 hypothetical protein ATY29_00790 [Rhizobium hidalgonense]
MKLTRNHRLMMASTAFLALAGPSFALDGADMMKKLNAATSAGGTVITFEKADVDGDTVTATGVQVGYANLPGETLKIGELTFEGVEETEGGGYHAKSVSFPDIDMSQEEGRFSAKDIEIAGLTIPANATGDTLNDILLYETVSTGPIAVNIKGKDVFAIEGIESNLERQDGGFTYDANVAGLKADLSQVEDASAKEAIEKLGLATLDGAVTMKGSWEVESGKIAVDEYAFDFKNIGRLNIAVDFSGYTLAFVKSLQEAVKTAEANPNKEEANQAAGLAMLGLMQQLTFNSASIRFDDASITKKALDYAGAQQGVTGDQLTQSLKGLVPMMMAQLNLPELQNQVSAAVNAYLDGPKNLTISAAPEKPVPFPMIIGAAMGAPNTIPSVLGVKVTAND